MSDSFFATKTRTQCALFLHAVRASILMAAKAAVSGISYTGGWTNTEQAIRNCTETLKDSTADEIITVLLTDGAPTTFGEFATGRAPDKKPRLQRRRASVLQYASSRISRRRGRRSSRPPGETRTTHGLIRKNAQRQLLRLNLLRRPPPRPLSYSSLLRTGRRALPLLLLRRHRRLPSRYSFRRRVVRRKSPVRSELLRISR